MGSHSIPTRFTPGSSDRFVRFVDADTSAHQIAALELEFDLATNSEGGRQLTITDLTFRGEHLGIAVRPGDIIVRQDRRGEGTGFFFHHTDGVTEYYAHRSLSDHHPRR